MSDLCTIARHDKRLPEPAFYCCPKTGAVKSLVALEKQRIPGYWCPVHYEETVADALSAIAAEEAQDWIPVTERLPETDDQVIVWIESAPGNGYAMIDSWHLYREDPTGMGGPTMDMGYIWRDNDPAEVTHWQPLPAAPGADAPSRTPSDVAIYAATSENASPEWHDGFHAGMLTGKAIATAAATEARDEIMRAGLKLQGAAMNFGYDGSEANNNALCAAQDEHAVAVRRALGLDG